jgi:hypothetical protein
VSDSLRRPRSEAGWGEHMRRVKNAKADEVRALKRMKEREIDTTDIPPVLDWSKAVVGKFYRPIKKSLCPNDKTPVRARPVR